VRKRKKGQGRKPSIYIRSLTEDELKTLRKAKKSGDSFTKDRASILLHSVESKTVKEICKCTSHARNTVVFAIKDFNEIGLDALQRKKVKGANPKFTKEQRAKILQIVNTNPKKLNLHFTTWSLPKLRKYLIKTNVVESICIESIRRILRSFNARIRKSKRWQYSNDPEFGKKNFELTN
jgi:transposase